MISLPKPDEITTEHLIAFKNIVIQNVDIEYKRFIDSNEAHRVFDYLLESYTSADYYTFFTPSNVVSVADYLFEKPIIRRFILNVTERVMMQIPTENVLMLIIEHTADHYGRTKSMDDSTIMPREIKESIAVNKEVLKQCLTKDIWLLIVFYIFLHLHETAIYTEAVSK